MIEELSFFVEGVPASQGSKTQGRYGFYEADKKLPAWRKTVTVAALEALAQRSGIERGERVRLSLTFYFLRPKTVTRTYPTVKPDLSKIIRAVEDSLTDAGVFADDCQITDYGSMKKRYADDDRAGVEVRVERI